MTEKEFFTRLDLKMKRILQFAQSQAPYATGNLMSSIKLLRVSTGYKLYVDTTQAPYMEATNGPWNNRNGKKNPNEGWWDETVEIIVQMIANELRATSINVLKKRR